MTTQQRLDCLLQHFDMLTERQGDEFALNEHDTELLIKQCSFADELEIAFYMRALRDRGFVRLRGKSYARITIDGYCRLDELPSG